jgi:hypothetical protein
VSPQEAYGFSSFPVFLKEHDMIRIFASLLILAATVATADAKSNSKGQLKGQRSGLTTTNNGGSNETDKARFNSAKTFYSGYEIDRR